ncbi:dehydrogenase [Candidatus Bathyarchaeota archaeon ex4484_205]|nr:MAG: dehydrogenase [Candidatus Bathyarchaeota archaeon ex4484_205]RLG68845.1 MAG: NAD(P)/FAD-dependent oxidoreductase [archaeon]
MRIQIYGAGIAGSFLHILLSRDFKTYVKDVRKEPDCICAWGTIYQEARELYREIGVNFDEYILARPRHIIINNIMLRNVGFVTFDRRRLLHDLWSQLRFGEKEADIVIDATGYERALLPKVAEDNLYPTIQFLEKHNIEEDVFIYIRRVGYAWAFPLGNHIWHVGAGGKNISITKRLLKDLRRKYEFDNGTGSVCSCRGWVRLLPPSRCKPFIYENIVGVGEAIGCVSSFGEGNIPALRSAQILYESLREDRLEKYEERILREFKWIEMEHKFVNRIQRGRKMAVLHLLPIVLYIESRRIAKPPRDLFRHLMSYLMKR